MTTARAVRVVTQMQKRGRSNANASFQVPVTLKVSWAHQVPSSASAEL